MTEATLSKLHGLVATYEKLIELLKEADDERLATVADSVASSLSQLNEMLAVEIDSKTAREMLKGLRQGLRETPKQNPPLRTRTEEFGIYTRLAPNLLNTTALPNAVSHWSPISPAA